MASKESIEFAERLKSALDSAGYPKKGKGRLGALSELFGVSSQAVARWLTGEIYPTKRINDIAQKLNVSANWLLTGQGAMDPNNRTIALPGQSGMKDIAQYNWKQIPVIDWQRAKTWRADPLVIDDSNLEQSIWVSVDNEADHFAVIAPADDDAMQPRFAGGEIIVLDPSIKPSNNQQVLIHWCKEDILLSGYYTQVGTDEYVRPHNPKYEPVHIDLKDKNIDLLGVCKQIIFMEV